VSGTRLEAVLRVLGEAQVEFVVIGGLAAVAHGSSHVTYDVDVCYGRSRQNIERLCAALAPLHPSLRGAPRELPFRFDPPTVSAGLNFTLETDLGAVDLLGELVPFGLYEAVVPHTEQMELFGWTVSVLSLPALIRAKRAAGRAKDLLVIPELEALLELRGREPE
jgi:hypothetical protein